MDLKLNKKLPNKLSDLLEMAMKDLAAAEKSKNHVVDMETFHAVRNSRGGILSEGEDLGNNKCHVCLAGAVMARSYEPDGLLMPDDFDDHTEQRLDALDCLRTGSVEEAFNQINKARPIRVAGSVKVSRYDTNRKAFKKTMRWLVKHLRSSNC